MVVRNCSTDRAQQPDRDSKVFPFKHKRKLQDPSAAGTDDGDAKVGTELMFMFRLTSYAFGVSWRYSLDPFGLVLRGASFEGFILGGG